MRIGVIGPCEEEILPFIRKIANKKIVKHAMLDFHVGTFNDVDVVSVICGVCKVNAAIATQVLIDKFEVTHIILNGVAGGLSDFINVGDIVISNHLAYHDVSENILTQYHPLMDSIYFKANDLLISQCEKIISTLNLPNKCYIGKIVTGESFITDKQRSSIIANFDPLCVDMESASVAHVCHVNNIPFVVIRSISDKADENGLETFDKNFINSALNAMIISENLITTMGKSSLEFTD